MPTPFPVQMVSPDTMLFDGEAEMVLHREDYILRGHGWIACGEPRAQSADAIEYYCE